MNCYDEPKINSVVIFIWIFKKDWKFHKLSILPKQLKVFNLQNELGYKKFANKRVSGSNPNNNINLN